MKLGNAIAALVMISAVAVVGAQGKGKHPVMTGTAMGNRHMVKPMSKGDWQRMYNQGAMLFDKKDANGLFSMMTPDFTMVMGGKTMNAEESKASMMKWFGMMKTLHCTMTVTNVKSVGGMAMVTDKFDNSGMTMPDPKTHKSGKLRDWGHETATWIMMNGKWMMKHMAAGDEHMTMNGKPFTPKM